MLAKKKEVDRCIFGNRCNEESSLDDDAEVFPLHSNEELTRSDSKDFTNAVNTARNNKQKVWVDEQDEQAVHDARSDDDRLRKSPLFELPNLTPVKKTTRKTQR